ncbi:hypothetical protein ACKAV7_012867 [Fusarium commune]
MNVPSASNGGLSDKPVHGERIHSADSPAAPVSDLAKAIRMEKNLVKEYRETIGGYFRRFHPEHFVLSRDDNPGEGHKITIESVLTYAFLRADLDFVSAQARKIDPNDTKGADTPYPHRKPPVATLCTCWSMVSGDSFGEERIAGLANSRAFGDMGSKRIGVSAEPELTRVEMGPAQYSFLVLMTDGISGTLSDQEIVDVVKEARTPEDGARNIVKYATEVSSDGDNATCQVVRLGGWERRSEGGLGSLGTKEIRDARIAEAQDPRRGKR